MIENCRVNDCQKRPLVGALERLEGQRDALAKALSDALAYIDLHQEPCQFDPPEITAARALVGSGK